MLFPKHIQSVGTGNTQTPNVQISIPTADAVLTYPVGSPSPYRLSVGDLAIVCVAGYLSVQGQLPTMPAGWNLFQSGTTGGSLGDACFGYWYRFLTASDLGNFVSVTWSGGTQSYLSVSFSVWGGAEIQSPPLDLGGTWFSQNSSNQLAAGVLVAATDSDVLLTANEITQSTTSSGIRTVPAGYTNLVPDSYFGSLVGVGVGWVALGALPYSNPLITWAAGGLRQHVMGMLLKPRTKRPMMVP